VISSYCKGKGLITLGDSVWINIVVLLRLFGLTPKLVWYWVALTEVEHLFKDSNTDKEVQLLCNILGVLFLTNFKSHLKSIIGDPKQTDEGT